MPEPTLIDGFSLTIPVLLAIARDPTATVALSPYAESRVSAAEQVVVDVVDRNYHADCHADLGVHKRELAQKESEASPAVGKKSSRRVSTGATEETDGGRSSRRRRVEGADKDKDKSSSPTIGRTDSAFSLSEGTDVAPDKAQLIVAPVDEGTSSSSSSSSSCATTNTAVYGITTGFGNFATVSIPEEALRRLQVNLLRSHAAGVGEPLSWQRVRAIQLLRLNTLAKGASGISLSTLRAAVDFFNAGLVPWVPCQGSVSASGDLAPLAHVALPLIGESKVLDLQTDEWIPAADGLRRRDLQPVDLRPKEGISLINGTQMCTALLAEAVSRARRLCHVADVVAALTLEVLQGTHRAFDARVHELRPHAGQVRVAARLRALLHQQNVSESEIYMSHERCGAVQDAYSLRCVPQVHGVVNDTLAFVTGIVETEMNSATDNPMVLVGEDYREILSAGNFHGEYIAKSADYLAIAVSELATISERRVERLVNPSLSGLPAFLVKDGGVNSGFMMVHVTASALVSENKGLCHPASVDSIPTSANKEDHVSMGAYAARKCLSVVENVERVLAIELMAACQGLEFHRPRRTTPALEAVYTLVRGAVEPLGEDRIFAEDMERCWSLVTTGKVWQVVAPFVSSKLRA